MQKFDKYIEYGLGYQAEGYPGLRQISNMKCFGAIVNS